MTDTTKPDRYDHQVIEKAWQAAWKKAQRYVVDTRADQRQNKLYVLDMFPYPSGEGLHVGHPLGYIGSDIVARYFRAKGKTVLHPMGWDAFGLPAENYAIKTGVPPAERTHQSIDRYRDQLQMIGLSYDWTREVNTSDPKYYRWTQWLFLKLYEMGLAYRAKAPVNWCPKDQTVLANEQVKDGRCERCESIVEQRNLEQWFFKITAYAEQLLNDLDGLDWPGSIKLMQKNWIGQSEGALLNFQVKSQKSKVKNVTQKPKESLKFRSHLIEAIQAGKKWTTFRMDPKDLKIGDVVDLIDWGNGLTTNQRIVGRARITKIDQRLLQDLPPEYPGHEVEDDSFEARRKRYSDYYHRTIQDTDQVYIYEFEYLGPIIEVFTTRPDTLFGATFLVLAPEHPLIDELITAEHAEVVKHYRKEAAKKKELDRKAIDKPKTGVFTGSYVVNPATNEQIPVWIADYVLASYGTGAIMAVPAHDERDYAFAKQFNLPIEQVIEPVLVQTKNSSAFRANEPADDHHGIVVLLKHWQEDKYLGLTWRDAPEWGTLLTGGIDQNMSAEETVYKEIREETGFLHAKIVRDFGVIHGKYYHVPKQKNRFGHARAFLVELLDGDKEKVSADDEQRHTLHWLTLSELEPFLTALSHNMTLQFARNEIYTGSGLLTNSGIFSGQESDTAKKDIADAVGGKWVTTYRLRDWLVSRQRYWGAPIPMIHCESCGVVPVAEDQLPVRLPTDVDFRPTGESPLIQSKEFHTGVTCPKCNKPARREVDTMDTFVDSSWYFLRYPDAQNDKEIFSSESINRWLPVDYYVGGAEHAVLHLLYARFFTKALKDAGLITFTEPFSHLRNQGMILGEDHRKMSKRWGNVINPDQVVVEYGADALRCFEMFMGPFSDNSKPWSTTGLVGVRRWLDRVWKLQTKVTTKKDSSPTLSKLLNQSILKITHDIEEFEFNTAISQLMILTNGFLEEKYLDHTSWQTFLELLCPFAPHLAYELWQRAGFAGFPDDVWPIASDTKDDQSRKELPVQINGKLRGQIKLDLSLSSTEVEEHLRQHPRLGSYLKDKEILKIVHIPGRIVNIVLR